MTFDHHGRAGLNLALREARWLDFRVNPPGSVDLLFQVRTLHPDGSEPGDSRIVLRLLNTARLAVSLRSGPWNDAEAETIPVLLDDLPRVVRSFEGRPICEREPVDIPYARDEFYGRLSLHVRLGQGNGRHSLRLLVEGKPTASLNLLIEFDDLDVFDATATRIPLADFIAGAQRWWSAQGSKVGSSQRY